jgi:uroporphyrinogen-III synthase
VAAEVPADALAAAADADVALVTSPSTVQRLAGLLGADQLEPGAGGPAVIAIGPVTAAAAASLGVRVDGVAERYDVDGLLDAVCRWALSSTGPDRVGPPGAGDGPGVRSGP